MTIEILLVDDQRLMIESIKAILEHEPEIKIVGTAQDGQSAIAQVIKLRPDLVLIDIEMPKMNGIVATKYICQNVPETRVIVLTSHNEQSYITEALQAGASGYLLKDTLFHNLKQAIHSLGRGYSYIEAKLLARTANQIKTTNVTKYQERVTYLKKYRKSIYKPAFKKKGKRVKQKIYRQTLASGSSDSGITRASLAPIFDFPTTLDLPTLDTEKGKNYYPHLQSRFNRQRYLRRIILILIAIVSFILSIIIF